MDNPIEASLSVECAGVDHLEVTNVDKCKIDFTLYHPQECTNAPSSEPSSRPSSRPSAKPINSVTPTDQSFKSPSVFPTEIPLQARSPHEVSPTLGSEQGNAERTFWPTTFTGRYVNSAGVLCDPNDPDAHLSEAGEVNDQDYAGDDLVEGPTLNGVAVEDFHSSEAALPATSVPVEENSITIKDLYKLQQQMDLRKRESLI